MKNNFIDISIVKKYAQAFMLVFPHVVSFSDVENIEKAQKFLQTHRRTLFFLQLPQLTYDSKVSMLNDLIGYFSLPADLLRLFLLLITHNRSFYIPPVLFYIVQLYKKQQDILDFSVVSSHSLEEKDLFIIKNFLNRMMKKNIICTPVVNKSLIAGFRLHNLEYQWEYSIKKQLQQLKNVEI